MIESGVSGEAVTMPDCDCDTGQTAACWLSASCQYGKRVAVAGYAQSLCCSSVADHMQQPARSIGEDRYEIALNWCVAVLPCWKYVSVTQTDRH